MTQSRLMSMYKRPATALAMMGAALAVATAQPNLLDARARCTLMPGTAHVLLRVEQDTTLPYAMSGTSPMSYTVAPRSPADTFRAVAGTPMPAARVRLLALDSITRARFAANGITDSQPTAFIRAAPYGADCGTLRWTDTVPFAIRGEVGYVRATVASRDQWIGNAPVFIIPDAWNYPYPRRGRPYSVSGAVPLASAEAMFGLQSILDEPLRSTPTTPETRLASDSARTARVFAWARAHVADAEREPLRTTIRNVVLNADWQVAQRAPSRLRGTYRVELDADGARYTWYFRTQRQLAYRWQAAELQRSTAQLLESPHVAGYSLVGNASLSLNSMAADTNTRNGQRRLVWLYANDRPTTANNDTVRLLRGQLEFMLGAAPEPAWSALEPFAPPISALDSVMLARMGRLLARRDKQPRLALTLRLDARGDIRADTTFVRDDHRLRVQLVRIDTTTSRRLF